MDNQNTNLILIGLMGCGKTTIGKKLAQDLRYEFVDTDQVIEEEQGCPISEVFRLAGEEVFRNIETKVLARYLHRNNLVMATGGGIISTEGNMELLKKIGQVVYIETDLEVLAERVGKSRNRPKIDQSNPLDSLQKVYEERKEIYEQADLKINSTNKTLQQTCGMILRKAGLK